VANYGCCKQEILATEATIYDISRFGVKFVNIPEEADLLVLQGFRSEELDSRILSIYKKMRDPKWVMAFGKCMSEEEPGFLGDIKVDVYVPGCPPRPEAFIFALIRLFDKR
jgi:NADH-quinone oxidoreductase subunit B